MSDVRSPVFGIGGLGLRLALAFLIVALASIIMMSLLTEISTGRDIETFIRQRQVASTHAIAVSAGALYEQPPVGWQDANLAPVLGLIAHQGNSLLIRNARGQVVRSTPGFGGLVDVPQDIAPVKVRGRQVGSVIVKYHSPTLGAAIRHFEAERLRTSLTATGIAALLALAASLVVSRRITLPLERMLAGVRARAIGDRSARIGAVGGSGAAQELADALNESSDAVDERDRLHRDFVANIAHELRAPVAVLQASHEAMIDGITTVTPTSLMSLREEVLRLTRMIDDLQQLAAAEAVTLHLQLSRQDLAVVAVDAVESLSDAIAAAEIGLEKQLSEAWAMCDPRRMREIIVNLLTNACKFTPAGGGITVTTGLGEGSKPTVTVVDTGIGIPPDDLPRISERFFRGRYSARMASGSGIGLTIVNELVRAQRGELSITSEMGRGTRVVVTLPAAPS
jgi:two-component system sensor histidine kinase BaeS